MREWSYGPWRKTLTRLRPTAGSSSRWCSPSTSGGGTRSGDRSVAGQAKARAEGRFSGRHRSLTEREYIRVERSKGVI